MTERDSLTTECYACVSALNQREGWRLDDTQIAAYAEQIVAQVPTRSLERMMAQVVQNFHADHGLVATMRNAASPENARVWEWASQEIARVAQLNNLSWSRDRIVGLDDLVQTVQAEVVRSLPDYRFESRLSTWLYGVTVRRLRRLHRDNSAAKRLGHAEPIEMAYEHSDESDQSERALLASSLTAEIMRALKTTGDKRYAWIFLMRTLGDMRNDEIAERLKLHPSRVRALLKAARALLRENPRLRDWNGDEPEEKDTRNEAL